LRYTDIHKVVEFIQVNNLENEIIEANPDTIKNIATNYVSEKFNKKLGKKK